MIYINFIIKSVMYGATLISNKLSNVYVFAYATFIIIYKIKRCDKYVFNGVTVIYLICDIESISRNYIVVYKKD